GRGCRPDRPASARCCVTPKPSKTCCWYLPTRDVSTHPNRVLTTPPGSDGPAGQIMLDRRGLLRFDGPQMAGRCDSCAGPAEERPAAEQDQKLRATQPDQRVIAAVERRE